ncbi:DGQHR domain-containing protein [Stutzerimonas stutzeri]|uniref:DGQHR domain-containing protein DpdB n=1 Tax=Stutzerimonas stutzeri TaxID=316 RepID=UPI000F7826A6|nr:DGQHR domain-containing protein DpdB [Stutzerimonas stutzeri]RRW10723.1 DGQHR domain-containing protein [Stutzerimonas stutzeri]
MIYRFKGIRAKQAPNHDVFTFAATPKQILAFSEIERIGRNEEGHLRGFQRHQVASHIQEIRDYLRREDALLPNAVILAFLDGVTIKDIGDSIVEVVVDSTEQKPGFVVDGQQRLSALATMEKGEFQVFVSALICKDYNELRQQFVLINNARPLPKSLIYELLPSVDGLPERFTKRKYAARIIDLLNSTPGSSLFCEVKQHTNPRGMLSDTAMQKLVMNSVSDGAIQQLMQYEDFEGRSFEIINNFFHAVKTVFGPEWNGLSPRHSRLKHGAGIIALGFVMDELYVKQGTSKKDGFIDGLNFLKKYTAWTSGQWKFSESDIRPWNGVQNTPSDIELLSNFLTQKVRKEYRQKQTEMKV